MRDSIVYNSDSIGDYPVTLSEVKLWLRIDADYNYDDDLLQSLIISETQFYEKRLNLGLVAGVDRQQVISAEQVGFLGYQYDWNWRANYPTQLNYGPVQPDSISAVNYKGETIDSADYTIYASNYPQIQGLPYGAVISYKSAGLDPFPEDLKRAIKMRVALAYESRTGRLDEFVKVQAVNPDKLADQFSRNVF